MSQPGSNEERRKRILQALGGLAVFAGFGLLLGPGLARHEPEPGADAKPAPARPADPDRIAGVQLDDLAPTGRLAGAEATDEADAGAFDCMIVPSDVVEVGSAITGLLTEIAVERGDYVEADSVVARLDTRVEAAAVRVAEARAARTDDMASSRTQLELSEQRLARAQELFEREVLSLDTRQEVEAEAELAALALERAEEEHRLANLQLEQARAALERRTIRTPVAGVVVDRPLSPGEVVDEETIARIARVDPLRVEAILPEDWFGRVATGDVAEVVPERGGDRAHPAEVVIVDPILDGASGTFGVELELPNAGRAVAAGMRCQVRFQAPGTAPVAAAMPIRRRPAVPPSADPARWQPSGGTGTH